MQSFAIVFLGGGLGSVVRYALGRWINALHTQSFPWGTFAVNVMACLVLGIVVGLADHKQIMSASSRLFWTVGFCGGFSTFSTFSHETLYLLQEGMTWSSITYILASLTCCIAATFTGIYLSQHASF